MRPYIIVIACIITTFNCFAQTQYPSGVFGCIARWTFDTVDVQSLYALTDKSGNNNHGTVTDINSSSGFRNTPNMAGKFNGTSSFARVTPINNSQLCPQNLTVVALIKFNDFYSGLCQGNNIIYHGYDYSGNGNWAFFVSDMGDCNTLSHQTESLKFQGNNQFQTVFNPNNNFIDTSSWYFLASSHNNQSTRFYVEKMNPVWYNNNLTPKYTFNETNVIGTTNYDVVIGKTDNPPYPYFINADIDEIALFNRDLSQAELQGVYQYMWGYANAVNNLENQKAIDISWDGDILSLKDPNKEISTIEIFTTTGARLLQEKAMSHIHFQRGSSSDIYIVRLITTNGQSYFKKMCLIP
jgi:hypothetical protein